MLVQKKSCWTLSHTWFLYLGRSILGSTYVAYTTRHDNLDHHAIIVVHLWCQLPWSNWFLARFCDQWIIHEAILSYLLYEVEHLGYETTALKLIQILLWKLLNFAFLLFKGIGEAVRLSCRSNSSLSFQGVIIDYFSFVHKGPGTSFLEVRLWTWELNSLFSISMD